MNGESKSIQAVLEETFSHFKQVTRSEKSIRFKNFEVIEVEISGVMFGVGATKDYSSMKIFEIKDDAVYEDYDHKKFRPIFYFGIMEGCGRNKVWSYGNENQRMEVKVNDFHLLPKRAMAILEVSKLITLISYTIDRSKK